MALVHLANEKSFEAAPDVSILDAARAAGMVLDHGCRSGRCGVCRAKILRGQTRSLGGFPGLSSDDRNAGYILTCADAAVCDIQLDIEDVGLLADYPVRTMPCRIDALERPAPDVLKVRLRFPPNNAPKYLAGQYVDVIGGGGLKRSYSIANRQATDGKVELHIRAVPSGSMSAYWFGDAKVGDLLRLEGPKGSFFLRDVASRDLIFLATGTGIAPVKAMLEALADRGIEEMPRSASVIWGGRHLSDLYWKVDIPALPSLDFIPVLSRAPQDWQGERGYIHKVLLQKSHDWRHTVVYACGSPAMIADAARELGQAGLRLKDFYADAFVSSSI